MSNRQGTHDVPLYRQLGKFWTAANVLSMARAVLVLPLAYLILIDGPIDWILGLIIVGALTDWFDGWLARWSHTVSEWGKVLDPLADKFAAVVVTLSLVIRGDLPIWFVVLILVRDILIVTGSVYATRHLKGKVMMSIWSGKFAIGAIAVTILAALLKADPPVMQFCIWATTALLVYSFLIYNIRYLRATRSQSGEPQDDDNQTLPTEAEPV